MVSPFDLKTALLAKHAQHVVLIHFPIALFITAVAFDLVAQWTKVRGLVQATYYNLLAAAISTVPVLATGLLAWQFQLEGQKLKGILLLHLVLACVSTVMIWLVWWVHFPRATTDSLLAELSSGPGSPGSRRRRAHRAFGRLSQRCKPTRLDAPMGPSLRFVSWGRTGTEKSFIT
jgi:uncharacterized membrane protein